MFIPEAGVLKENPVAGFWANSPPPRPRDEVVVVVVEVLVVTAPRPPKLMPPVAEAGALEKVKMIPC